MNLRRINWKRVLLFIVAPVVLILLIVWFSRSCSHQGGPDYSLVTGDSLNVSEPTYLYGICIDSLYVEEGQIEPGQFLSTLCAA